MAPSRATSTVLAIRALTRSRPRPPPHSPFRLRPPPPTSNSPTPPYTPHAATSSQPAPSTPYRLHRHHPSTLCLLHSPSHPVLLRPWSTRLYSSSTTEPPPSLSSTPPQSSSFPSAADDDDDAPVLPDYLSEGERAVFEKVKRELRPSRLEVCFFCLPHPPATGCVFRPNELISERGVCGHRCRISRAGADPCMRSRSFRAGSRG